MTAWQDGFLILDDGASFIGKFYGEQACAGEVVFNTSHSGYEEVATDPSYFQQILVMTAPHQGNYGVDAKVWQSDRLWIQGFAALDFQESSSDSSWLERLREHGVPAFKEIDTRRLVIYLREKGARWGALVPTHDLDKARQKAFELIEEARLVEREDWTLRVSCREPQNLEGQLAKGPLTGVLDFGCKKNILQHALRRSQRVHRLPAETSAAEIRQLGLQALILSNGPGDPQKVQGALEVIKELLGEIPMLGICMGHQLLGRALGGTTYKLQFGHRGGNHPVKDLSSGRIFLTSQNHGYAVAADSLPADVKVTHLNLNDRTVSGIHSEAKKAWGVQFHPEASPGPREAQAIFDHFFEAYERAVRVLF